MSTVQPTDKVMVQRGTTLYSAPIDMSTVQDTDLILVNRGGVDYKCTIKDWRGSQVPTLVAAIATAISGKAEVGGVLTVTPGVAGGGTAPITYATKWQISNDGTSGWTDIGGATGATYTILAAQLNKYIRALTTATDATAPTAHKLEMPSSSTPRIISSPISSLGWNADTDGYTRDPVAGRIIDAHSRMRRCLVTDLGAITYLDADDSTKLAGDWLRICETTELSTPYTGTHGVEIANTALRASAPAWVAGTHAKGQRVTHGGSVWECLAATTTATPAAGTTASVLSGTAGQVMVEIPRFSVWHETAAAGTHLQHKLHLIAGTKTVDGFAVHPAFIRPDGSLRDHIYVGAYHLTGTSPNGSASGVVNKTNISRAAARTACKARGANWHQLGYWDYSALQWLLFTEYQDMNCQRVLGSGAVDPGSYNATTGLSNARGNRCGHFHNTAASNTEYVSYRGVENVYGRAWQYVDGLNLQGLVPYVCGDPSKWSDNTATGYTALPALPVGIAKYIRDIGSGVALMPSNVTGGSATTYVGDTIYTGTSGWYVARVGGQSGATDQVGLLCAHFLYPDTQVDADYGGRLSYTP